MAQPTTSLQFIRSRIAVLEYRLQHYKGRRNTEATTFIQEELDSMLQVECDLLELMRVKGEPLTTKN